MQSTLRSDRTEELLSTRPICVYLYVPICTYTFTHTLSECEDMHIRNLNIEHSYLWISLIEICECMPYSRYAVTSGHLHVLE